jgi:hypothetical protein
MANFRKLEAYRDYFLAISCGKLEISSTIVDTSLSLIEENQKFHFSDLVAYRRSVSWMQSLSYIRGFALRRVKRELHENSNEYRIWCYCILYFFR